MKKRFTLLLLSLFLLILCMTVTAHHEPATNKDGSIVTDVLTASFDPFGSQLAGGSSIPSNLGFSHFTDGIGPC